MNRREARAVFRTAPRVLEGMGHGGEGSETGFRRGVIWRVIWAKLGGWTFTLQQRELVRSFLFVCF